MPGIDLRGQGVHHPGGVLVGQRREHRAGAAGDRLRLQRGGQLARGLRVVADVDQHLHPVAHAGLQAPAQARGGDALGVGVARQRPAQRAQGGDGGGGVGALHRRAQLRQRQLQFGADIAPAPAFGVDRLVEEVAAGAQRIGADRISAAQHAGGRIDLAEHQRFPRPRDAGLFRTDRFAVGAEPVGVVDVHGGDDRHIGIDQVHRIQPAAEADFQHGQVQLGLLEQPQRRQRAVLEVGQRGVAARGLHCREGTHQVGIAGLFAVDAYAFVVAQQVRRGVAAHAPAGGTRDRLDEGDSRALAVGAADGDDVLGRLGQAHARCHGAHPFQAHGDVLGVLALDIGEPFGKGVHVGIFNLSTRGARLLAHHSGATAFALTRESLFFACAKKSNQKKRFNTAEWLVKHTRAPRPTRCALRVRTWPGHFSTAHPCAGEKRRASCAPPLRGFRPCQVPRLTGSRKAKQKRQQKHSNGNGNGNGQTNRIGSGTD